MKISTLFLVKIFILSISVKVWCREMDCTESGRALACSPLVCNIIQSRESDFCKDIQCEGLSPQDCPPGTVLESGLTMCGCCSGCAKYQAVGEPCEVTPLPPSIDVNCTDPMCPILKNDCQPGLGCKYLGESSKVCAPIPYFGEESCQDKRNRGLTGQLHWNATCEIDGTFSPKQCKGSRQDGVCFCVDIEGKRIFGREDWNKAENQTCACSRQVHTLRSKYPEPPLRNIATIHCSPDGNYEPLQCDMDSGLCYCVDKMTGKLSGAVVPEDQWKLLPCYSVNLTDGDPTGQYLRNCESAWAAGQRLQREGMLHGVDVYAVPDFALPHCDYDGSFSPLFRYTSQTHCVPKNGKINENGGYYQLMDLLYQDCQCFRDRLLFADLGRPTKPCSAPTGNYAATAEFDSVLKEHKCVDKDGVFYGDPVPVRYKCCLLGEGGCDGEPADVQRMCKIAAYEPCKDSWTYS